MYKGSGAKSRYNLQRTFTLRIFYFVIMTVSVYITIWKTVLNDTAFHFILESVVSGKVL